MRILRMLVVLLLPSCLVVLAAPAPPAAACSCADGRTADFADWADTVFVGRLNDVVMPPEASVMSSGDPVTYAFDVTAVYEGEARERTHVRSAGSGASCGLEGLVSGESYLVFAVHQSLEGEPTEELWANLCGGTGLATGDRVGDVETVLGSATPPQPGEVGVPPTPGAFASLISQVGTALGAVLAALT